VLVLAVAILLAAIAVAAFPCWSYSAHWGYAPSVIAGSLLLCAAMIVVSNKSAPKTADTDVAGLVLPTVTSAFNAFHRRIEIVSIEPENASQ
jgi:hypothetical protein